MNEVKTTYDMLVLSLMLLMITLIIVLGKVTGSDFSIVATGVIGLTGLVISVRKMIGKVMLIPYLQSVIIITLIAKIVTMA